MSLSDFQSALESIDTDNLPSSLGDKRRALAEIFAKQICDGQERSTNPYFTNDRGNNVGMDVALAASAACRQLSKLPEETTENTFARLLGRLERAKAEFKGAHSDTDGYGAGTFGEIERDLIRLAVSMSIDTEGVAFRQFKSNAAVSEARVARARSSQTA